MQIINQRTATVPLDSIAADPANPNQGDIGAISESIQSSGFFGHVLVQESTGRIIAGAHRHAAARALGATEIPVTYVDVDDERARRIMLADNRTQRLGSDDPDRLATLLQELAATPASLAGTGYDGDALDELLADLGQMQPELAGDPDAVPEAPDEPVSRRGDLWVLGEHRVLCGDATSAEDVRRLLNGAQPALTLTDLPYGLALDLTWRDGVGANSLGRGQRGPMAGDDGQDWERAFSLASAPVAFVWHHSALGHRVADALVRAGFEPRQEIIWLKTVATLARHYYHWKHESCWFAVRVGAHVPWYADRTEVTVWEAASPKHIMAGSDEEKQEHPSQKPAILFVTPVRNHTRRGEAIYDPFLGSGTALAAAETEGRRCYGMEIEPRYVDVAVRRWEQLTGKTAVREQAADDARVLAGT